MDYRSEIESCFNSSYRKNFKRGRYYEPEIDWDELSDKIEKYLTKATLLFQRQALEEAADNCSSDTSFYRRSLY